MTADIIFYFLSCYSLIYLHSAKEVTHLPGLDQKINFRHYSGYLKVSPTHFLHYWFTESQSNPAKDPVLLWLNGGPGCSSLMGLISELGPFHIKPDGRTIYLNKFAWNKVANVLFLESPAGVGFSYSSDKNVSTNDDQTSMENHEALKQFFKQFPQFRTNDLYIAGESYGGVYVPTLVKRILDGQHSFRMNIKGLAIGNGILDYGLNTDTLMKFAYYHGLVGTKYGNAGLNTDTLMKFAYYHGLVGTKAKQQSSSKSYWAFTRPPTERLPCKIVGRITTTVWSQGLNVYDLYQDCYHPKSSTLNSSRFWADLRGLAPKSIQSLVMQELLHSASQESQLMGDAPCINDTAYTNYFNRKDVRKALHIKPNAPEWSLCSDISYEHTLYQDMKSQIRQALSANLRVLIYNGDTDMACNFLMGQEFPQLLNLTMLSPKLRWLFDGQVVGFVTTYEGLDFISVKGAGHMVPQSKPAQSLHMISQFLKNQPY